MVVMLRPIEHGSSWEHFSIQAHKPEYHLTSIRMATEKKSTRKKIKNNKHCQDVKRSGRTCALVRMDQVAAILENQYGDSSND